MPSKEPMWQEEERCWPRGDTSAGTEELPFVRLREKQLGDSVSGQNVLCHFRKPHAKALLTRCFDVTEGTPSTLSESWKKHSHVHCPPTKLGRPHILVPKLSLEEAEAGRGHRTGLCRSEAQVVEELVPTGRSVRADVDGADTEELGEDRAQELAAEEGAELRSGPQGRLLSGSRGEDGGEEGGGAVIKSVWENRTEDAPGFL